MAIKAIINNTEKEIEQIKNSDEQDIDYVYSRIGDTEVEGELPISIKSIGGNLADYRIYGNTVGGESVGDRTGNLFDGEVEQGTINTSGAAISAVNRVRTTFYNRKLSAGTYTISANGANGVCVMAYITSEQSSYDSSESVTNWPSLPHAFTLSSDRFVRFTFKERENNADIPITPSDISNIMLNSGSTALPYEPYGYKVPVTISNDTDTLTTPIYLPEPIKMVGDEAEYIDYSEQKMHRIGAEDIDVTLPALSTIKGTNTLSVNTSIQPSNIYIKDNFDYKKVFTATRTIEGESPLNYRSIEDSDSTLSNYRIYGNTVGGENVGDRTGNLFDKNGVWVNGYINDNGELAKNDGIATYTKFINVKPDTVYSLICDSSVPEGVRFNFYDSSKNFISRIFRNMSNPIVTTPSTCEYITLSVNKNQIRYLMIIESSTAPTEYEPYGYKVPVTVSNGTDTLTTPIYLPEQIKKVGEEAEYIDYGEQKQHRVRKNLLPNTATSQTVNGVTFTVNADGSITCSGILTSGEYADLIVSGVFLGDTDILENGNYVVSCANGSNGASLLVGNSKGEVGRVRAAEINISANLTWAMLRIRQADPAITLYPMIRKADIEDDTYEPYIENVDLDVTLPALPTLPGTNVLSVGTEVQPSDIYLKGKIKKKPKIYYKIYYYSQDGQTALSTETVEEGHDCTYSTVPTKESDTDFDYTFTGWSTSTNSTTATAGATENIQQNTNLYAAFSKSFKTDTISDSWEEIIANCDNGTYASKYQIGDLKTIDVGTEGPVQMQIVAIDTDLLASDNTKKAPITWISKQLLNTYKAMHSTSSNYLSDWTNCDMRTYLKNTVLPMLPSVVQNNIKEVTKYTNQRTGSTTFTTISSTEDIWLPSYREVVTDYYNSTSCETSGVQYNSIFTNDDASQRIKSQVGDDDASFWWTRSASAQPLSNYSYYFAYVGWQGYTDYTGWVCTSFGGVAIGFCT